MVLERLDVFPFLHHDHDVVSGAGLCGNVRFDVDGWAILDAGRVLPERAGRSYGTRQENGSRLPSAISIVATT